MFILIIILFLTCLIYNINCNPIIYDNTQDSFACIHRNGLLKTFHGNESTIAPCMTKLLEGFDQTVEVFYRDTSADLIHEKCVKITVPEKDLVVMCQLGEIMRNSYPFPKKIERDDYTVTTNEKEVIYKSATITIILERDGTLKTLTSKRYLAEFKGTCTLESLSTVDISDCIIPTCSAYKNAKQITHEINYLMIDKCIEKGKFETFAKEFACSAYGEKKKDVITTVCRVLWQIFQECPRNITDADKETLEKIYSNYFHCTGKIDFPKSKDQILAATERVENINSTIIVATIRNNDTDTSSSHLDWTISGVVAFILIAIAFIVWNHRKERRNNKSVQVNVIATT